MEKSGKGLLLRTQQDKVSEQKGLPVEIVSDSQFVIDVPAEVVQLQYYTLGNVLTNDAGQLAGTVVVAKLANGGVLNQLGDQIATVNDSSLAFTSTAFLVEVAFPQLVAETYNQHRGISKAVAITQNLSNGQFCVDNRTGTLYGKKASVTTTLTGTTYKVSSQTASGGTVVTGDTNLAEVGGVAVSVKNAAFAEPPLGIGGEYELLGSLTTDAGTAGDKIPFKGSALGVPYMNLINIAGTKEAVLLEGATHATGDAGIMPLVIRNDTLADLSGGDGKYGGLQVTAKGALYTSLSEVLGATMSVTNGGFMQITDNTTVAAVTAGLTALKVDLVGEGGAAITATNPVFNQLTDGTTAIGTGNPLTVSLSDGTSIVDIGIDGSTIAANPQFVPIGGEYRAAADTYTDGDGVIDHFDVNGFKLVRDKAYDAGTTANKGYEVNPVSSHYVAESLLDTTNLAAATNYYPSSTGASIDGYKDLSISGKFIDADGTFTMTVEAMNDEDTTSGDWIQVYGYDDKNNVTTNSWTVTNGTLTFALSFNEMNFTNYRIKVINDGATNTAIIKTRRKAL